jgi:hyperosmotically inducible periplasmic protein
MNRTIQPSMKRLAPMKRLSLAAALCAAPALALAGGMKAMSAEARDAYREGQIWATYVANPTLEAYKIDIDIEGSKVTLGGKVESLIERRLAERIALHTEGITSIENNITVDPALVVTVIDTEPSFADFVADATRAAMIDSKLLWNDYTDGLGIRVDVLNGVATLTGKADTEAARELAGRLALGTPGVVAVKNQLTIDESRGGVAVAKAPDGDDELSDTWIAAKVDSTLLWTSGVDGLDIDVEARDGKVMLKGPVDSEWERELAIELAQNIRGVKQVDASGLVIVKSDDMVSQR